MLFSAAPWREVRDEGFAPPESNQHEHADAPVRPSASVNHRGVAGEDVYCNPDTALEVRRGYTRSARRRLQPAPSEMRELNGPLTTTVYVMRATTVWQSRRPVDDVAYAGKSARRTLRCSSQPRLLLGDETNRAERPGTRSALLAGSNCP